MRDIDSRRNFLRATVLGGAGVVAVGSEAISAAFPLPPRKPGQVTARIGRVAANAPLPRRKPDNQVKTLALRNMHTGERDEITFSANGVLLKDGLKKISWLLRDHRREEAHDMDPKLLDLLHRVHAGLGKDEEFKIISGYRSPRTNAMLRRRSGGVAKKSYHMLGKAIDVTMDGVSSSRLRRVALAQNAGGVGYYPRSNFVHMDTGPVRTWRG
ncbi:MAG: hypothetical protein Alpg2KO_29360 [Alphaproteobacteria bacterium]